MSRRKHTLCESFCPKQILLSSFPKETSHGQPYYTCALVHLSVLPAAFQYIVQFELHLLFESITILAVSQKLVAMQKEMRKETQMHNFLFRHLTHSLPKTTPLYKHLESLYLDCPGTTGTQSQTPGSQQAAGQVQEQCPHSCPYSPLPHQSPYHP